MSDLPQLRPDNAPAWAFFWDSNSIWGWVASPEAWQMVVDAHDWSSQHLAQMAGRADFAHPSALLAGAPSELSFGLRREHRGASLQDYAREHGLGFITDEEVARG